MHPSKQRTAAAASNHQQCFCSRSWLLIGAAEFGETLDSLLDREPFLNARDLVAGPHFLSFSFGAAAAATPLGPYPFGVQLLQQVISNASHQVQVLRPTKAAAVCRLSAAQLALMRSG
eukprot:1153827-Pelagomonas_calceolata.AAC.7